MNEIEMEILAARKENEEQARLLGISGSREAKLIAALATERDQFGKREIELMLELEKYKSIVKELSEAVQVAIDRLEAYGMTTDHLELILSKTNDL